MKMLIVILVLGVGLLGGWQAFQGMTTAQTLQQILQDAIDATHGENEKKIRDEIIVRATANGIVLSPMDIQVSIVLSDQTGYIGGMVAQGGIQSTQRKVTVTSRYPYSVLMMKKEKIVTVEKSFSQQVQMNIERNYDTAP